MIKASVNYTKAAVTQPASGELSDVKFLLANNPKKMHYMAYVNNLGQLETPFFGDASVTAANYYPDLGVVTAGDFTDANGTATAYGMENSNKEVKKGNATYALIQGKFTPKQVVDKNGSNAAAGADFWRIRLTDGSFTPEFYNEDPTTGSDFIDIKAGDSGAAVVKYTGGECYYAFYLADNSVSNNATLKYTVKRNSFWKMTITDVSGVGSNTPGGVVSDLEVEDPIEANTFIKGTIQVLDWSVYNQSGGI